MAVAVWVAVALGVGLVVEAAEEDLAAGAWAAEGSAVAESAEDLAEDLAAVVRAEAGSVDDACKSPPP